MGLTSVEAERAIEQLSVTFEQGKPYLLDRWDQHHARPAAQPALTKTATEP
jgi:hypothetical protein